MTDQHSPTTAPDFTLTDTRGQAVRLSDYRNSRHIVLVFNRGLCGSASDIPPSREILSVLDDLNQDLATRS